MLLCEQIETGKHTVKSLPEEPATLEKRIEVAKKLGLIISDGCVVDGTQILCKLCGDLQAGISESPRER